MFFAPPATRDGREPAPWRRWHLPAVAIVAGIAGLVLGFVAARMATG